MANIEPSKPRVGLNVSLTADLAKFVESMVESGQYASASEVLREGLRMLVERDRLRTLRREGLRALVLAGLRQSEAGAAGDGDAFFEKLESQLDEQERLYGKT